MIVNVLANMAIIFIDIYIIWRWRFGIENRKDLIEHKNLFILTQTLIGICLLLSSFSVEGVLFDFRCVLFSYSIIYLGKDIAYPSIVLIALSRFFFGDLLISSIGLLIVLIYCAFIFQVFEYIQERYTRFTQLLSLTWITVLIGLPTTFARLDKWPVLLSFYLLHIVLIMIFVWITYHFTNDLDRLYQSSVRDCLTNLYNTRKLEEDLGKISENNHSYGILILDIDHFKQFNDQYGHLTGDKVLEEIGLIFQSLNNTLFDYYRYGGEEFVSLVFDGTGRKTEKLAKIIHKRLANHYLYSEEGQKIKVTASIGIAYRKPYEDMKTTFARADEALYQAKSNGRNQTVIADRQRYEGLK